MKKNTKILIAVALVVLLAVYLYLSFSKKPTTQKGVFINPPDIPNLTKENVVAVSSIDKSQFNFPESLPFVNQKLGSVLSEEEILTIGKNFGFFEDPSIITGILYGKSYIWSGDKYSLQISPSKKRIVLTSSIYETVLVKNAINKQLSENDIKSIASNFLVEKIGLNEEDFKFSSLVFLKANEGYDNLTEVSKDDFHIYQVNFSPSVSDYPIYTLDPKNTVFNIRILKDGSVLNAEINMLGPLTKGEIEYPILSYAEFQNEISKAKLIRLNDGNINLTDLATKSLSDLNINSVELVYLLDDIASENLQPVFLLKGTATVVGFGDNVTALLYLPAFSGTP